MIRSMLVTMLLVAAPLPAFAQSGSPADPQADPSTAPAERRDTVDPRTGRPVGTDTDTSDRRHSTYGEPYRITTPWQNNPLRTPYHR